MLLCAEEGCFSTHAQNTTLLFNMVVLTLSCHCLILKFTTRTGRGCSPPHAHIQYVHKHAHNTVSNSQTTASHNHYMYREGTHSDGDETRGQFTYMSPQHELHVQMYVCVYSQLHKHTANFPQSPGTPHSLAGKTACSYNLIMRTIYINICDILTVNTYKHINN